MRVMGISIRRSKGDGEDSIRDRPKIYVTPLGAQYVKTEDLLRSKRGQEAVKKIAKLFGKKRNNRVSTR